MVGHDLRQSLLTSNGPVFCERRSGWIKIPPYRGFDRFQKWKSAPELNSKQKARDDFFRGLEVLFALKPGTLTTPIQSNLPSIPVGGSVSDVFIPPSPLASVSEVVDSHILAHSISGLIGSKPDSPHANALVSLLFGHLIGSPLDNCFELCPSVPKTNDGYTFVPVPIVSTFFVDPIKLLNRTNELKGAILRSGDQNKQVTIVRSILDLSFEDALERFDRATANRLLTFRDNLFWTAISHPHPDYIPLVHQAQIVSELNPKLQV